MHLFNKYDEIRYHVNILLKLVDIKHFYFTQVVSQWFNRQWLSVFLFSYYVMYTLQIPNSLGDKFSH